MIYLENFTDKIAASAKRLIRKAYEAARARDHNQIEPEHLLFSISEIERTFFNEVMQSLNLDPQVVIQGLETRLGQHEYLRRGIKMSESFRSLLSNALKHSHEQGRHYIESSDIFVAIFKDTQGYPVYLFKRLGTDSETVIEKIQRRIG